VDYLYFLELGFETLQPFIHWLIWLSKELKGRCAITEEEAALPLRRLSCRIAFKLSSPDIVVRLSEDCGF
jgi:hypothetical protein